MTTQDQVRFITAKHTGYRLDLSFLNSIKQGFFQLKKAYNDKRTYKNMSTLPDYILKDIGITREDIQAKLENPVWEPKK